MTKKIRGNIVNAVLKIWSKITTLLALTFTVFLCLVTTLFAVKLRCLHCLQAELSQFTS